LGVVANGVVGGFVYVDVNGSRSFEAESDTPLSNVIVRLLVRGTRVAIATGASNQVGEFTMEGVPVGNYVVAVDSATVGDSVEVVSIDGLEVTMAPDDTVAVRIAVGFPLVTAREARTLTVGQGVFVEGVALHDRGLFGDSTLHVADTSGAIRAARVSAVGVTAGDSVRVRATIGARSGQPTLDAALPLVLAITTVPAPPTVTSAAAATAVGGGLDAALVRVLSAGVTDTATSAGDFTATADDGSGPIVIVFDRAIAFNLAPYVPGAVLDVVGLLVPTGGGSWVLKPRSDADLVAR
jgi:hypothetical protein